MIETLIRNVAGLLSDKKIPYMLIGGQAVLLYGRPRLTNDIDITLGVDVDNYSLVKECCDKLKLKVIPGNPREFVEETNVLPAEDLKSKFRVDFIFSYTLYERQAIERAKSVKIKGRYVKFAAIEDVIIHKMIAARAIDIEDVVTILTKNRKKIDLNYVRKWLKQFSQISDQLDILERFNEILRESD